MSAPKNYHEIPRPSSDISRKNRLKDGNLDEGTLSRLWRPKRGSMMEQVVSTLSRFSHRLIDRTTGDAYSADELEAKILDQVGGGVGSVRFDVSQTLTDPEKLQARENIGADASAAALTFAGSDPNGVREILISSDDTFVDGTVLIYAGAVFGEHFWSISGNLPNDGGSYTSDELHLTCADVDIRLIYESGVIAYSSSATHAETEPWLDSPIPPFGTGVFEIILTEGDSTAGATATHLGQWCKATTAWWQWNGSVWIPRFTIAGDPIAYNATLAAFRKLVVSGADGSEIITISTL